MAYRNYTEKEVRKAILKKASPTIISKRAPHWRGKIFIQEVYFSTVKIPNPHNSNFGPSKAKHTALQLGLSQQQYNDFMSCALSGKDYYHIISSQE